MEVYSKRDLSVGKFIPLKVTEKTENGRYIVKDYTGEFVLHKSEVETDKKKAAKRVLEQKEKEYNRFKKAVDEGLI